MKEKFFSVIIPNYNNSTYLEKCLKSVLNQTFINYELIVIDDVSTDNSVEIIKNIFNEYKDKDTKLIELKEKAAKERQFINKTDSNFSSLENIFYF